MTITGSRQFYQNFCKIGQLKKITGIGFLFFFSFLVMNLLKAEVWCLILIFIIQSLFYIQPKYQDNFTYGLRFRSLECQSDNTTMILKYCYLKPLSRKTVGFNVGVKILKPLTNPFFLRCVFFYRYGTIFREIIDIRDFNFCDVFDQIKINPLIKLIYDMVKSSVPETIHECPYIGDWDMRNFTVDMNLVDKATMMFPEGIYRVNVFLTINGSLVHKTVTSLEAKSPLKENFG